ncbi:MAG: MFS transporter [Alphaproteobacteria bacterium]
MPDNRVEPRLGRALLAGYAAPGLGLAALTFPVYIFLPAFYGGVLGLAPFVISAVLLGTRLWDMVTDPLLGWASDRYRLPGGHRKGWMLIGLPLVMLGAWMLFVPPEDAGWAHLLAWSLVMFTGWSALYVPHMAMAPGLSADYHQRTRLTGWREGAMVAGSMIVLGLAAAFSPADAEPGESREALQAVAIWVLVALPIGVALLWKLVPEPEHQVTTGQDWRSGAQALWQNSAFRKLIAAYVLNAVANGVPASLFLIYAGSVLQVTAEQAGILLMVYFLVGVLAVPLWLALSRRYGKHKSWCGAMVSVCVIFAMVPLLGEGDFVLFLLICMGTGLGFGADLALPGAMQADVVDEDQRLSGQRRAGLIFALWGMATKASLAVSGALAFAILGLVGFDPDADVATLDDTVRWTIIALYGIAPIPFKLISIAVIRNFPLTEEKMSELHGSPEA